MKRWKAGVVVGVIAVLAVSLGLAALFGVFSTPTAEPARKIEVALADFTIFPAVITVKSGEKLILVVTNKGRASHDFGIRAGYRSIAKTKVLQPGESQYLELVAPGVGEYKTYCTVQWHEKLGMAGKLIVEVENHK